MIPSEVIIGLAVLAGCVFRSLNPFLKKQLAAAKEGKEFKWRSQYTITIILSLILSVPTAMFVLTTADIPQALAVPFGFMAGYTATDITNRNAT